MITSNWTIYAFAGALIAFILLFGYVWPHHAVHLDKPTKNNFLLLRGIILFVFFVGAYFALSTLWRTVTVLFLTLAVYISILYFLWQHYHAGTILLKLDLSSDENIHLWMGILFLYASGVNFYDFFERNNIWIIQLWSELPEREMSSLMLGFLYLAFAVLILIKKFYKKTISKKGIFSLPFVLRWDKMTAYRWQLIKPAKPDWYLEIQQTKPQFFPIRIVVTAGQKAAVEAILEEYCAGKNIPAND